MFTNRFFSEENTIPKAGGFLLLVILAALFVWLDGAGLELGGGLIWIGILISIRILFLLPDRAFSLRYLPLMVLAAVGCLYVSALSFRYFLFAFATVMIIECLLQKSGGLILAVFFVVSPVFTYFSEVFTFPIRLFLSEWAGKILILAGNSVEIEGNTILSEGVPFHVDPVCMGLQMLAVSMLGGIFLLAHFQFKGKKKTGFVINSLFFLSLFLLNMICNLIRIVLLVHFRVMPESVGHDWVGIGCLLLYVLILGYYLAESFVGKWGVSLAEEKSLAKSYSRERLLIGSLTVSVCIMVTMIPRTLLVSDYSPPERKGFQIEKVRSGIFRYQNSTSLVYLKQIPAFYSVEHSPLVCWRGSGFQLRQVRPTLQYGTKVYTGKLVRDNEELYTAWWFSNGRHKTVDPVEWRWRMLKGHTAYRLVNVTAANQEEMEVALSEWLSDG